MSFNESLEDVAIRERQLEAHILRSSEYRKRAYRDLKRLVLMLYLAVALLALLQVLFTVRTMEEISLNGIIMSSIICFLGAMNCLLLINTKKWFHHLNEAWLGPQERIALDTLKSQRHEILTRLPRRGKSSDNVELN